MRALVKDRGLRSKTPNVLTPPPQQSAHFLTVRGAMGSRCCSATYPSFSTIQRIDVVSFRKCGLMSMWAVMEDYMIGRLKTFGRLVAWMYVRLHTSIYACTCVCIHEVTCFVHTCTYTYPSVFLNCLLMEFTSTTS